MSAQSALEIQVPIPPGLPPVPWFLGLEQTREGGQGARPLEVLDSSDILGALGTLEEQYLVAEKEETSLQGGGVWDTYMEAFISFMMIY